MKLNANNGHISRAVAECLTSKHALNKFYRGDCLAEILNQIAGLQGDDALSAKNIAKVFNGDEGDNYTINYNDKVELKLECLEGVGQNDILSVYRQERSDRNDRGSKKFAIVGRFESEEKMEAAYCNARIVTRHTTSCQFPLSDATKVALKGKVSKRRVYSNDEQPQKPPGSNDEQGRKRAKQSNSKKQQSGDGEAAKEDASQHEVNIRRLEEKYGRVKKTHDAAIAAERKAGDELRRVHAELNAARSQLESSSRGDRSVPQDEMDTEPTDTEQMSPGTTDEENNNEDITDTDDNVLYFTHGQCGGQIRFDKNDVLKFDDLQQNSQQLGTKMGAYTLQRYGQQIAWVPNRAELIGKGHHAQLAKKAQAIDKLNQVFAGQRCTLPQRARNMLAACNLLAYGCGDEAKSILQLGTCKALLIVMELDDISNEAISKAMPKRGTVARDEHYLAAMARAVRRQEMRDDNVESLGGESDHGKRKGLDHLVFPVNWIARGKFGLKLKSHVISTNHTGGSATATALGIKKAMDNFTKFDKSTDSIKLTVLTGDTGGGSAVQNLITEVKKLHVMSQDCAFANCLLHGLNKPTENASVAVFGKQGIGHRTCWQLLYLWSLLRKRAKLDSDVKHLNEMWAEVVKKVRDANSQWRKLAEQCMPQLLKEFLDEIKTLEARIEELNTAEDTEEAKKAKEKLLKITTEYPKNIRDPVFSRWQTTDACARPFLRFFVVNYFFCVAIVKSKSSKSYLVKLAKAMLSLVNARTSPQIDEDGADDVDGEEEDGTDEARANELVEAQSADNDASSFTLQPGQTPIVVAQLLFFRSFCDFFQTDNFAFMMKPDPALGKRSFGHLARFVLERISVMNFQICQLENGGYKIVDEFKSYIKSLQGIHKGGVKDVCADYFEKTADLFIKRIRQDFNKHVRQYWLTDDKIHYMLGGDKEHAQQICKWMTHHAEQAGIELDDDELVRPFPFVNREVTLSSFHDNQRGSITLNLQSSMEYITSGVDPSVVLKNEFVKDEDNWQRIQRMADADQPIDLFDQSTWGDLDLQEFQYRFACAVCIHPTHQQLSESYVQALALVALTGIGEFRRGNRIESTSGFLRYFTEWAAEIVDTKRLQGAIKAELLLTYMDKFQVWGDRAIELLGGPKVFEEMMNHMKSVEKQSDVERAEGLEAFKKGVESDYSVPNADKTAKVDVTARVGGRVTLSLLIMKNDTKLPGESEGIVTKAVHAELKARNIKLTENEMNNLTLRGKVHRIRGHEFKELRLTRDLKQETDVSDVEPWSVEMKAFLNEKQDELLAAKGK